MLQIPASQTAFIPSVRYRGLEPASVERTEIRYGQSVHVTIREKDLLTLVNVDGGAQCWLLPLAEHAQDDSAALIGLDPSTAVRHESKRYDSRVVGEILTSRGLDPDAARVVPVFDASTEPGERFVFRAQHACRLFAILPTRTGGLESGGGGRLKLEIKRASSDATTGHLPDPLGTVVDEWRIPKATAHAYEVRKGQFIQIIDVEGQQCSDFMAMRADALDAGLERFVDSTVTRAMIRGAYPTPGLTDKFFDQDMQPLLALRRDTVGRHDTFGLACTARGYEERGFPGHINCSDNISGVYGKYGIKPRAAWPAINFFFNSWILPSDNALSSDEGWSRPGDYVVMQALTDLVCVSTACPDDVDPINGWNPTDVHVRVYDEDSSISRAIRYRAEPEDEGKLTTESSFHPRTSALTGTFHIARDVWLPASYDGTRSIEEYWACREAATLQDMSSLRKFDIMGPDAERLLQICMTRNVARLSVNRGLYGLLCDESGCVIDDGTLFRMAPDVFRWCCGADESGLHLQEQAQRHGLRAWVKSLADQMPNLALQGPRSRDILQKVVFTQPTQPTLESVKWFGFTIARLRDRNGAPFMLTRTGFTGELGYEIFCDSSDALAIWDALMEAGKPFGLKPMGGEALATLRIEAGLMVAGAEFGPTIDAYEAGLGFAVDLNKPEFIGRDALLRISSAPKTRLVGLRFNGDDPPAHGDGIFTGRRQVGIVTSATRSPALGHAIAMGRVSVEHAEPGTELEVGRLDGHMKRLPCQITGIPFIDPKRERARA